jgi:hypothetical protein
MNICKTEISIILFRHIRKTAEAISVVTFACPIELRAHWADFHEICYLMIFRKSVEKIRVLLNLIRITGVLCLDL